MKKGQYQLLIGIIVLASVAISLGLVYYFSVTPKIEINQTTTTTAATSSTTSSAIISSTTTQSATSTSVTTQPTTTTTTTPECKCSWFTCNQNCGSNSGNLCVTDSNCFTTSSTTTTTTTSTITSSTSTNSVSSTTTQTPITTSSITTTSSMSSSTTSSTSTTQSTTTTTTIPNQVIVAADGTGDYTDIQSGINALPNGGNVIVKNGIYVISSTIVVPSNIFILGAGNSTKVQIASGTTNLNTLKITGSNVIIKNIQIDGNKNYVSYTYEWSYGNGIWILANNVSINGLYIHDNAGHGILAMGNNTIIRNNIITFSGKSVYAADILLYGSEDHQNPKSFYNLVELNILTGNKSASIGGDGIFIDNSYNNTIKNNSCNSHPNEGIALDYSKFNLINNNTVFNNKGGGIFLDRGDFNNIVINNLCNQNLIGTWISDDSVSPSSYNIFSSNSCHYNQKGFAINNDSFDVGNTITNNDFSSNTNCMVPSTSANNILQNNLC